MDNSSQVQSVDLQQEILALGEDLLRRMGDSMPSVFDTRRWEGRILELAMADPSFKTDLFRFVDVLPSLDTPAQVADHAREYLLREGRDLPGLSRLTRRATSWGAVSALLARVVRRNVERMAGRFIVGRDAVQALPALHTLHGDGYAFTVDLLGEATLSDAEAKAYQARYLDLLDHLPGKVAQWPDDPVIDHSHLGPIPRANVSLKLSALEPHLDPIDLAGSVARLKERLLPLLMMARDNGASLHIDLEDWETHEIALSLFEEVAAAPGFRDWPHLGFTIQTYLHSASTDVERVLAAARSRGTPVAVRLVKGAYWETEVIRARQHGTPCPVFLDKARTDDCFETTSRTLLQHADWVQTAFASHNLRSLAHAAAVARARGLPPEAVEVQTLQGMAEPERAAFRALGHRVRVYAPVGELLPGMAYLVRRLLENTSNHGFLRLTHREGADPAELFAAPATEVESAGPDPNEEGAFHNCPLTDFTDSAARQAFSSAVAEAADALPRTTPVVVAGEARQDGQQLPHPCPSHTDRVATLVTLASPEEVETGLSAAAAAFPAWRDRPIGDRAKLLEVLADRLEADRFALAAVQVHESGKPWREADADVAEAIDFCRYYAHRAPLELGPHLIGAVPGEENQMWYEGRGPTAVIAPWNFPLAILTGMSTAALVAGNPVLLKPAEQSSATGYALFRHLMAAGFPQEVVQFLPGIGEEVGMQLVSDPRVATVAFTGSKEVGLSIVRTAGHTEPGQPEVKRVVCEMGGKNAAIVDADADLDAAVAGVVTSAFGYAGQKCSACSRLVVVGSAYPAFRDRLVEACRSLHVAPAEDPACQVGPLIDRDARDRVQHVVDTTGDQEVRLYLGQTPSGGNFVPPALFEVRDPRHRLLREEFFGPVVALLAVDTFDQALGAVAVGEYALTGSVYSRTPSHLDLARRQFRVGNLYLNRGCTAAMVGRQPFGGTAMSGAGTKAGGPGYLLHFAQPRCVTENTLRRGFSPDVQV